MREKAVSKEMNENRNVSMEKNTGTEMKRMGSRKRTENIKGTKSIKTARNIKRTEQIGRTDTSVKGSAGNDSADSRKNSSPDHEKNRADSARRGKTVFLLAAAVAVSLLWGCSGTERLPEKVVEQSELVNTESSVSSTEDQVDNAHSDIGKFQQEALSQEELDQRYYYSLLDEESRQIYRELVQGIKEGQEVIVTHGQEPDAVNEICTWVFMDYPEFFWCSGTVETTSYSGALKYCEVRPEYTCASEERAARQQQIDESVAQCLAGLPAEGSTYEKIRYLYDWLVDQTDYAEDSTDNQNIYSVFANRRSVCAGYSRAFQYLTGKAGIYSIYVTGTVNQGQSHAWNIVACDGEYYQVDVTFGDPVFVQSEGMEAGTGASQNRTYYDYLCVPDTELYRTHTPDAGLTLPACTSTQLEYYRRNGRYFEQASQSEMLALMQQDIDRGDSWSDFKYASEAAYQEASAVLPQVMDEAATYLCTRYDLAQTSYQYSQDPESLRITVYWNY